MIRGALRAIGSLLVGVAFVILAAGLVIGASYLVLALL